MVSPQLIALALLLLCGPPATVQEAFDGGFAAFERGDYDQALAAWRPLAEQGLVEAQYNLALLYESGRGVAVDLDEAVRWYEKAAGEGFVRAQYGLASLYERRQVVPGDLVRAYAWFKLAGQQKFRDARKRRGRVAERLNDYEIAQGDLFVREWNRERKERR